MGYKRGDWFVFCDICGRRTLASETTMLPTYSGRGGLIACKFDADYIDHGTIPYKPPTEQNVPWTRINHTSTVDSAPIFNYETDTVENISSYIYLANNQNEILLTEDGFWIALSQER